MILLDLFFTFFRIGLFTFGGGYAMLPLIQQAVLGKDWASETELINFVAVSESTPGPFAINMATYIGSTTGGFFGAVCATLGVVLPSFIIILIVAKFFERFKDNRIVSSCMYGLKSTVVGLIGAALLSMAVTVFAHGDADGLMPKVISVVIYFLMLYLGFKKKLHPIAIIAISACIGIVAGFSLGM